LLARKATDFPKQDIGIQATTQTIRLDNIALVIVQYHLHRQNADTLIAIGSEVVSIDGLCPVFNACLTDNIFHHYFGVEFHHDSHTYVCAISSFEFVHCFGFTDQLTYRLSHPTCLYAMDAAMPGRTSAWLLKQVHSHLLHLRDANCEIFSPNQFAAPAATIQAFVNGAIGVRLPSRERWIQAYSDDTELCAVQDLILNPSKINSTTLNAVNFNYRAPLWQSHIIIEDGMLIYCEPIRGGTSYTCLQLVPLEFYNIVFIAFHSNPIGSHFNTYRTLHCIRLRYYWPGMYSYIKRMCNACPGCALANPTKSKSSELVYPHRSTIPRSLCRCLLCWQALQF
jgi:hypothetical protein